MRAHDAAAHDYRRHAGGETRDDIGPEHGPTRVDAGKDAGGFIAADAIDLPSEAGELERHPCDQRSQQEQDNRDRQTEKIAAPEDREPGVLRVLDVDVRAARVEQHKSLEKGQHRKGHDQRVQSDEADKQPVACTDAQTGNERHHDRGERTGHIVLIDHDHREKRKKRTNRKIEAASQDDKGDTQRHHAGDRDLAQHVQNVSRRQERARIQRDTCEKDQESNHQPVPAQQASYPQFHPWTSSISKA